MLSVEGLQCTLIFFLILKGETELQRKKREGEGGKCLKVSKSLGAVNLSFTMYRTVKDKE